MSLSPFFLPDSELELLDLELSFVFVSDFGGDSITGSREVPSPTDCGV